MKRVPRCTVLLFVNLITMQAVFADSIGDRFRSWLLGPDAQASILRHEEPELGRIAQECIQCHNGARATQITVKDADAPLQLSNYGAQVNHPVGMYYDDYASTKTRGYTPRFSLDSNIILVDGKVTCVSCHRLKEAQGSDNFFEARWDGSPSVRASPESCSASKELTVGPRETDLCLACHSM